MIRISVTWLDQYLAYLADDEMTGKDLADRLFGQYQPNEAMLAGTAMHSILEHADDSEDLQSLMFAGRDGFRFVLPSTIDGLLELGDVREQKHVVEIIPGVNLVGKIDAMTSLNVIDHKLTGSFDPERYMGSYQWRCYLAMLGRNNFTYQIFEHNGMTDDNGITTVNIKDYHRIHQSAYAGMVDDVKGLVAEFAPFVALWKPKYEKAAA